MGPASACPEPFPGRYDEVSPHRGIPYVHGATEPTASRCRVRFGRTFRADRILFDHLGTATEEDGLEVLDDKSWPELVDQGFVVKAIDRDVLRELLDQFVPGTETLADVVDRLGDVPLRPHPLESAPRDGDRGGCDPTSSTVSRNAWLNSLMASWWRRPWVPRAVRDDLRRHSACASSAPGDLGVVGFAGRSHASEEGGDRMPDISFTAWSSLPHEGLPDLKSVAHYPPDFAVEILSQGNRPTRDRTEAARILRRRNQAGMDHRSRCTNGDRVHRTNYTTQFYHGRHTRRRDRSARIHLVARRPV